MSETLKLWFFRDLTDEQRLKLFGLFDLPVDEIGKVHGRQMIALRHVVRKLLDLIRDESGAPAPVQHVVLAPKHTGLRVDYTGLLKNARHGLRREPGTAEMLNQLEEHLSELGRRWYDGDATVVDEFLQLYCIQRVRRDVLVGTSEGSEG